MSTDRLPYENTARRAVEELVKGQCKLVTHGIRIKLHCNLPWYIRWRPKVRRWLRETEQIINDHFNK